jgi:methionine-rich copper-binding protein CopC
MTITIEPSDFLAYMHTTYDFKMTISTSESVQPGIYYIWWRFVSPDMPDHELRGGHIKIKIKDG